MGWGQLGIGTSAVTDRDSTCFQLCFSSQYVPLFYLLQESVTCASIPGHGTSSVWHSQP